MSANTTPAKSIRPAPTISMRRRPTRSAWVVIHSEMAVSPSRVRVSSSADLRFGQADLRQVQHQHDRQEPVGEQAQHPGGEQDAPVRGQGKDGFHRTQVYPKSNRRVHSLRF